MSLLIKALQKAEQGKRSEEKTSAPVNDMTLELAPMHAEPRVAAAVTEQQSANPAASDPKQASQQAASAMLKAKSVKPANSRSKRIGIIAGIGLVLLLGIGLGFYSYLKSLQQPTLVAIKPPVPPTSAAAQPQTATTADTPTPVMEPVPAKADPIDESVATRQANEASSINAASVMAEDSERMPKAAINQSRQPLQSPSAQPLAFGTPIADSASSPVKITRNSPAAGIDPAVLSAYQAFMAGNDAKAQSLYWQALRTDTRNIDAMLGMAAIAARQGRHNDAAGWYAKVMEIEPRNTVAQAAMISLLSEADPVTSESRIKNLLAQKPEAAYLHAALGNLYAGQNQWAAAQQAYFDAYHFDNDNAEYAFNLAVSLDHLGKKSLALQYYKEARSANTAASNIDRAQLESRIAQLQ